MNPHSNSNTFSLGETYMFNSGIARLNLEDVDQALDRHALGDWGDFARPGAAPAQVDDMEGFRLISAGRDRHGHRFYIITAAHRGETFVLVPEDFLDGEGVA